MQYKVPQNIDLEDRIVGPFTMRQFVYILVGGGIIYAWWQFANQYVDTMMIFMPLALPIGFLTFCFAVVKINDRPFEYFLLNMFRFLFAPKKRMWQEGYKVEDVIILDPTDKPKTEDTAPEKSVGLDDLSKNLEAQANLIKAQNETKPTADKAKPSDSPAEQPASANQANGINLSVKDIKSATQKQVQAQSSGKDGKKKFLGIFK